MLDKGVKRLPAWDVTTHIAQSLCDCLLCYDLPSSCNRCETVHVQVISRASEGSLIEPAEALMASTSDT